jgi:hypothetical protein
MTIAIDSLACWRIDLELSNHREIQSESSFLDVAQG